MAMVYVKAKPDRRAYYEGRVIPNDRFVPVTDDPYIRRLIDHWGDLEVEGGAQPQAAAPAPQRRQRVTEPGPTPPMPGGGRETLQPSAPPAPGTGAPKPRE